MKRLEIERIYIYFVFKKKKERKKGRKIDRKDRNKRVEERRKGGKEGLRILAMTEYGRMVRYPLQNLGFSKR